MKHASHVAQVFYDRGTNEIGYYLSVPGKMPTIGFGSDEKSLAMHLSATERSLGPIGLQSEIPNDPRFQKDNRITPLDPHRLEQLVKALNETR